MKSEPLLYNDAYFMREAMKEAMKAFDKDEVPVGAVVVCNNTIIGRGHNMTETLGDVTAHAEMIAITAAVGYLGGKYLSGCDFFVTLEPCVMCAGALFWARPERIIFGAGDPKNGYSSFHHGITHPKTTVASGLMADESAALLKSFFENKR